MSQEEKNPHQSSSQQPHQPGLQNPDGKGQEPKPDQKNNDPSTFGHYVGPNPNLQLKHDLDKQGQKDLHGDFGPPDFNPPQPFQRGPGGGRGGGASGFGGIGPSF